jgi:hypothetical protein
LALNGKQPAKVQLFFAPVFFAPAEILELMSRSALIRGRRGAVARLTDR